MVIFSTLVPSFFSIHQYCWYSYGFPISTGVWFGTVNLTVHAVMYTYYAVRASGYNPPRWCARAITSLQLSQMFVGLFLNFSALRARYEGRPCRIDWFDVGISIFFYASYAILFCNFYYWTYLHKRVSSSKKPTSIAPESNGKLCINGHVKTS
jgi:elongation of very long chain fatty acids protein 6